MICWLQGVEPILLGLRVGELADLRLQREVPLLLLLARRRAGARWRAGAATVGMPSSRSSATAAAAPPATTRVLALGAREARGRRSMATPVGPGGSARPTAAGRYGIEARELGFVEADVADGEDRTGFGRRDRQTDERREPVDEPGEQRRRHR